MNRLREVCLVVLIATIGPLAAGCGGGAAPVPVGVIVKGKLVQAGAPLQAPQNIPGGSVSVELVPVGAGSEPASAMLGQDGSFAIVGAGKGVKPGQYKLALSQASYLQDKSLQQKFSAERTPIKIDVPADKVGGEHDVGEIDLDKAGH